MERKLAGTTDNIMAVATLRTQTEHLKVNSDSRSVFCTKAGVLITSCQIQVHTKGRVPNDLITFIVGSIGITGNLP
jgi:hypothetical protein